MLGQPAACILLLTTGATAFDYLASLTVQDAATVAKPAAKDPATYLETLPTPKEFKDAIASLSPEQQRFAKAYRSMQLEGSVFAVLVVQLKPQLEAVLNLPAAALTLTILGVNLLGEGLRRTFDVKER